MKTLTHFFVCLVALSGLVLVSPAFASLYDAAKIYKALNVKEVNLNPGIAGSSRTEKAIGGLSCIRSLLIAPGSKPSFACTVDNKNEDPKAIYSVLKVKEINVNPGIAGSSRLRKSVGGLTCEKSRSVYPGAPIDYQCQIAE